MTEHIEKTGKHIYGVRFSWVRAGWIKVYPFLLTDDTPHAFVTYPAEIVLNMDDPKLYKLMRDTLAVKVMPKQAHVIATQIRDMELLRDSPEWDKYHELLLFLLKLEQARREQKRRIKRRQ